MISNFVELSVGMTTEGIDVRSVGNTLTLHETALVEAFNLKAAIEYQLKNCKSVLMHAHFIQASMIKFFLYKYYVFHDIFQLKSSYDINSEQKLHLLWRVKEVV